MKSTKRIIIGKVKEMLVMKFAKRMLVMCLISMMALTLMPSITFAHPAQPTSGVMEIDSQANLGTGSPDPTVLYTFVFDRDRLGGTDTFWDHGTHMTCFPAAGGAVAATAPYQCDTPGLSTYVGNHGGSVTIVAVVNANGGNISKVEGWLARPSECQTSPLTPNNKLMTLLAANAPTDNVDAYTGDTSKGVTWLNRAVVTGQLTLTGAALDDLKLKVGNAASLKMYIGTACLDYCRQSGSYHACVKPTLDQGGNVYACRTFEYEPLAALDADFKLVNFGDLAIPSLDQIIPGNYVWDPQDNMPTIQNLGNTPLELAFKYDPLLEIGGNNSVTTFDLEMQAISWNHKAVKNPMIAGESWTPKIGTTNPVVDPLPLCNKAKLNFSIDVLPGIQRGLYTGHFYINYSSFPGTV